MSARQATYALMQQLGSRGICNGEIQRDDDNPPIDWEECECCGSYHPKGYTADCRNDAMRWPSKDVLGIPYRVHRIPDREAGALRRVKAICSKWGLYYYHQTDPRGCALYVSNEPLPDHNYTRGVACCA